MRGGTAAESIQVVHHERSPGCAFDLGWVEPMRAELLAALGVPEGPNRRSRGAMMAPMTEMSVTMSSLHDRPGIEEFTWSYDTTTDASRSNFARGRCIAVERLGGRLQEDLKRGKGPIEVLEFLGAVSEAMAIEECGDDVDADAD